MPVVDRMEFPRRFKLKQSIIVVIVVMAIFGIWLQRKGLSKLSQQVSISEVRISNFGTQFIELEYYLSYTGKQDRELTFKAVVWDASSQELASALFSINVPANSSAKRSKLLDRLNRTLKDGERPYKAEISLYTHKVP